ncbi:hypothetical protein BKA67DRAFT_126208 [Truncatella angustata]|uniref:Uncharacterized protein n=1 Tax=Truncatella angustata TaxID=152316 RepID=A0A9P8RII9_9PEZI|nr:uncharacterized protein BKA67DRAFT_126208 [Truncatella angustata]KAH6644983.1 hypothetical protein BKA67DRAFT_126208 [Truncatella angustata]
MRVRHSLSQFSFFVSLAILRSFRANHRPSILPPTANPILDCDDMGRTCAKTSNRSSRIIPEACTLGIETKSSPSPISGLAAGWKNYSYLRASSFCWALLRWLLASGTPWSSQHWIPRRPRLAVN